MKLTVLADNYTYIDRYYFGEPAFSCHIEDEGHELLFDAGYSHIFIDNAKAMGIDLSRVETVAISHGHNDHTGGLVPFTERFDTRAMRLVAHPDAFNEKRECGLDIGSPLSLEKLERCFSPAFTKAPAKLSPHIYFLGEIPRLFPFEDGRAIGESCARGKWAADTLADDTALAIKLEQGIFIVTGCSHSGICNIIEHAKRVLGDSRVLGVLGGFHLFDEDERISATADAFLSMGLREITPCHCVSLNAKLILGGKLHVREAGVGMTLTLSDGAPPSYGCL